MKNPVKKKNWCDVAERNRGTWLLRTFLKSSLKIPSIFCEFIFFVNSFFHLTKYQEIKKSQNPSCLALAYTFSRGSG